MDINDLQALMGESIETEDYRDVWVIDAGGQLPAEVLGEARRVADALGAYVHYVGAALQSAGSDAIAWGADRAHIFRAHIFSGSSADSVAAALADYLAAAKPEFVFMPAKETTNEIAGRLAARLGGGAILNCVSLRLDESSREIVAAHPVYNGAYYLESSTSTKPQIFTLAAGALPAAARDDSRSGEIQLRDAPAAASRVRTLGRSAYQPPTIPLRNAARVVAVGRGGNDEAGVAAARQLAKKIGAHFAGDRSAFDSGWIKEDQIVGVVGAEIAPDLYIAAGIWGDTMHRAGVEGARHIIAIHPDEKAPILSYADEIVVARPKEVLPQLLSLL